VLFDVPKVPVAARAKSATERLAGRNPGRLFPLSRHVERTTKANEITFQPAVRPNPGRMAATDSAGEDQAHALCSWLATLLSQMRADEGHDQYGADYKHRATKSFRRSDMAGCTPASTASPQATLG